MRRPTVERQYYSDEKRGTPAKVICTREEIRERYVTAIEVIRETSAILPSSATAEKAKPL